jgi:hypothetical protein
VARKIEFYLRKGDYDADIRLEPVVLTADQVDEYQLPRVPVKDSDRRKANFEAAYGRGQTELDALEALHPGVLRVLVEKAILNYYDLSLRSRAREARWGLREHLNEIEGDILEGYSSGIEALNTSYEEIYDAYQKTRDKFAVLAAQFQEQLDAYKDRMSEIQQSGQALHERIFDALGEVEIDLDEFPLPEPDLPADREDLLYDSRRGYGDQLAFYTAYRNGEDQ